jgi:hypothetical protein
MRKFLMIIVSLFFLSSIANAQLWKLRRYELTAGIGTTQFFGDIGGFSQNENLIGLKDFTFRQTRLNINAGMRYRFLENVAARFNGAVGYFRATDARGSNENRGFESRTFFFERSVIGEYYFIKKSEEDNYLLNKGQRNASRSLFSMLDFYVFTGFGGLSYYIKPNDKLEPRVNKKSGFTIIVPAGIGVNLIYSTNVNFGLELGGRYTFSDNIEGYSSSFSKSKDHYSFLNFTFTYKIKTLDNGLPSF